MKNIQRVSNNHPTHYRSFTEKLGCNTFFLSNFLILIWCRHLRICSWPPNKKLQEISQAFDRIVIRHFKTWFETTIVIRKGLALIPICQDPTSQLDKEWYEQSQEWNQKQRNNQNEHANYLLQIGFQANSTFKSKGRTS